MSEEKKVIHDINASLSAICQALELIKDNWKTNPDIVEKILPLVIQKSSTLENDWEIAKNIIKNKG